VTCSSDTRAGEAAELARAGLAEAIVLDGDQVLLVRRKDVPVWTLPGGHRDPGETADTSCVREVQEETGIEVAITAPLGLYHRPWWLSGGAAAVYRCERTGGEPCPGEYEAETRFWPVGALPSPILYWYPALIQAAFADPEYRIDPAAASPTLRGFLGSLLRVPSLWLPLARHALDLQLSSRLAQWKARWR
jgi:ADP-ribose pyrophosphatase YjhB (NUDIX family)